MLAGTALLQLPFRPIPNCSNGILMIAPYRSAIRSSRSSSIRVLSSTTTSRSCCSNSLARRSALSSTRQYCLSHYHSANALTVRRLSMAATSSSSSGGGTSQQALPPSLVQDDAKPAAQQTVGSSTTTTAGPTSNSDSTTPAITAFQANPIPDFSFSTEAWSSKTTKDLLVAYVAFGLCRIPFFVRRAELLLGVTRKVLGDRITDSLMQQTLFGHFCAGTDETSIQPVIHRLERAGIGSILDFAAEDDGSQGEPPAEKKPNDITQEQKQPDTESSSLHDTTHDYTQTAPGTTVKVRVYDYESEAKCDGHVDTFLKCIQDVASLQKDGYAAIKITALGNPKLLERMSRAIVEAQNLFRKFDVNGDGMVSHEEFEQGFHLFFRDNEPKLKSMLADLQHEEDVDDSATASKMRQIDYIAWSMLLEPRDLPQLTASCIEAGPLANAAPTDEEVELMERMFQRAYTLAEEAAKVGTRLLIDAEQARFQPAIDNLVWNLQRKYNDTSQSEFPVIYNTYQCYLKDVLSRLNTDVERSERYGYHFGAKLVRGAYMESERALAATLNYPSPIHETIEETHDSYNGAVEFLLKHAKSTEKQVELMVASHNQESVEKAIAAMNAIGIDRKGPTISFGQLYGMMDHLTFNLGLHGYRAYKYVPYGPVKLVMPYLIRRANENSSLAGASSLELDMIMGELKRRTFG